MKTASTKTIRVLRINPGENPRIETIEHTLENLQSIVGGLITATYPYEDPVGIIACDEGKFNGSAPNRVLEDGNGTPYDIIFGTFLIVGLSEDDFADLNDELAEKYSKFFYAPELFFKTPDKHIVQYKLGCRPRVIA